jgi:hypothetical protein
MKHSGLVMVDPDNGVIVIAHILLPGRRFANANKRPHVAPQAPDFGSNVLVSFFAYRGSFG